MRKSEVLIAANTRNSVSKLAATYNIIELEMRSCFGGKYCDLFQGINTGAVNQHKYALTLRRRIKSHLLFASIIRSSPFSLR